MIDFHAYLVVCFSAVNFNTFGLQVGVIYKTLFEVPEGDQQKIRRLFWTREVGGGGMKHFVSHNWTFELSKPWGTYGLGQADETWEWWRCILIFWGTVQTSSRKTVQWPICFQHNNQRIWISKWSAHNLHRCINEKIKVSTDCISIILISLLSWTTSKCFFAWCFLAVYLLPRRILQWWKSLNNPTTHLHNNFPHFFLYLCTWK